MKRIVALLLITAMLISALGCYINAGTDYIKANRELFIELSTPTVDGTVSEYESWYGPLYMNEDTLNFERRDRPLSMFGKLYFAVDSEGLYFAAEISEDITAYDPEAEVSAVHNKITPSTLEAVEQNNFNGDVFALTVDVLDTMISKGYSAAIDRVPEYLVTFCEDGTFRVKKPNGRTDLLPTDIEIKGSYSEYTMQFEMCIPWEIIIEDIFMLTFRNDELSVEDIVMDYSTIRLGAVYYDRYMDEEKGEMVNYNRYVTAPDEFYYSSTPGHRPIKVIGIDTLGIKLSIFELCRGVGHDWSEWREITPPGYFSEGEIYSYCLYCGKTRTKKLPKKEYTNVFGDCNTNAWYSEGVEYCIKKGYMTGMGNNRFSPNTALTREQCVVVLANMLNVDTSKYIGVSSGFDDVPVDHWYSAAVAWAADAGYVKGMSADKFGIGQKIQRAAFARLIYFAAQDLGADMTVRADLTEYVDHDKLPEWAYEQLSWAVGSNIILSIKDDVLMISPYTQLKRAQCATMLWQLGLKLDSKK